MKLKSKLINNYKIMSSSKIPPYSSSVSTSAAKENTDRKLDLQVKEFEKEKKLFIHVPLIVTLIILQNIENRNHGNEA